MEDAKRTVNLPEDMYKKVEGRLADSDFYTVDDYITYVVQAVLDKTSNEVSKEEEPKEDDSAVRKRLQDLGYLG